MMRAIVLPMTQTPHARIGSDALTMHGLTIRFHRTLRVPGDGRVSALPPSLGAFPLHRVDDHPAAPAHWREHGGVFLCMRRRQAMWMSFSPARPVAIKVGVGGVNAVTGDPWRDGIDPDERQDYLVAPPQPWLDGVVGDDHAVSQFVAMPLGSGATVEGQITTRETVGGIQIAVHPPLPGTVPPFAAPRRRFPPQAVSETLASAPEPRQVIKSVSSPRADMGIAPGGAIRQHVYDDPHGAEAWDDAAVRCFVHLVDEAGYRAITGAEPPPSPVTYRDYVAAGLPWFAVYDEGMSSRPAGDALTGLRTVDDLDADEAGRVRDGEW